MIINTGNLRALTTGFRANFQSAFDGITPTYPRVATMVSSSTSAEEYPWLGAFPRMRKWVGDRVIKNLTALGYGVGFGFWQMAFGSKAALDVANFNAARLAMENFKSDEGVKLGIKPNLLVIGASNEAAAEDILLKQNLAGGESNVNYKRVTIEKVAWLD